MVKNSPLWNLFIRYKCFSKWIKDGSDLVHLVLDGTKKVHWWHESQIYKTEFKHGKTIKMQSKKNQKILPIFQKWQLHFTFHFTFHFIFHFTLLQLSLQLWKCYNIFVLPMKSWKKVPSQVAYFRFCSAVSVFQKQPNLPKQKKYMVHLNCLEHKYVYLCLSC